MGAKKLSDADQAQAVLDLLQGKGTMAEICNRYGISPTYLYKLRDRDLEGVKVAVTVLNKLGDVHQMDTKGPKTKRADNPKIAKPQ